MKRWIGNILSSLFIAAIFIALEAMWDYFHEGFEPIGEYAIDVVTLAVAFIITELIMQRRERGV